MPEQLSFSGFEAGARPTESLFLAIFPDPEAALRISQLAHRLRDKHGLTGRPLAARRFHVSLHYIADHVPPDVDAAVSEAVASLSMPPFRIVLDSVLSLGRNGAKRPLVLSGGDGAAGLVRFQHMLGPAMERAGLGHWIGASWLPHLTLLYDARPVAEQRVDPVSWTAREIVLVHSLLGRDRYVPLARLPLRG